MSKLTEVVRLRQEGRNIAQISRVTKSDQSTVRGLVNQAITAGLLNEEYRTKPHPIGPSRKYIGTISAIASEDFNLVETWG